MRTDQFVELYRSLWPSGRDIEGDGFQALWEEVVADVSPKVVARILRDWRRRAPFPPTIEEFDGALEQAIGRKAERLAAAGNKAAIRWLERRKPVPCEFAARGCLRRFASVFELQANGHLGSCKYAPQPTAKERARSAAILRKAMKRPRRTKRGGRKAS